MIIQVTADCKARHEAADHRWVVSGIVWRNRNTRPVSISWSVNYCGS